MPFPRSTLAIYSVIDETKRGWLNSLKKVNLREGILTWNLKRK